MTIACFISLTKCDEPQQRIVRLQFLKLTIVVCQDEHTRASLGIQPLHDTLTTDQPSLHHLVSTPYVDAVVEIRD